MDFLNQYLNPNPLLTSTISMYYPGREGYESLLNNAERFGYLEVHMIVNNFFSKI